MTSFVPFRAFGVRAVIIIALATGTFFVSPPLARASDGYVVGFAAAGVMLPSLALDVTFIVATAAGLTYEDEGWAIAQTMWSAVSIGACVTGIALSVQESRSEGFVGGLALIGGAQAVLLGYAIHALARGEWRSPPLDEIGFSFGIVHQSDGAFVSLGWRG